MNKTWNLCKDVLYKFRSELLGFLDRNGKSMQRVLYRQKSFDFLKKGSYFR